MHNEEQKHTIERASDENLLWAEIFDDLQKQGVFVLIITRRVAREKLFPIYYMRDQVEKVFELCKQGEDSSSQRRNRSNITGASHDDIHSSSLKDDV